MIKLTAEEAARWRRQMGIKVRVQWCDIDMRAALDSIDAAYEDAAKLVCTGCRHGLAHERCAAEPILRELKRRRSTS